MQLYEKLLTATLLDGDEPDQHVQYMVRNRSQLRAFGVEVDDTHYKLLLLRNFSTRFDSLSVALETPIDSLSIWYLHARVFHKQERQKTCDANNAK